MRVIERTTQDVENETKELFQQCVPYLDRGMGLVQAVRIIKQVNHNSFQGNKWYKELRAYARSQGYKPLR